MGRAGRRVRDTWSGLIPALIVAAGISACAMPGFTREPAQSGQDCYRDDFGGRRAAFESLGGQLPGIAERCRTLAGDASRPRRETIYANFFAGKAWRITGQQNAMSPADAIWGRAEAALRDVVEFNGPPAGPRSTPADLRFELTRIEAGVELAEVLAKQSNKKEEAVRRAREAIAAYSAYIANPVFTTLKDEANTGRVNASLTLAEIHRLPPVDDLAALVALQPFIDRSLDNHPHAIDARADIIATANRLGALQLAEGTAESLRNAQNYFNLALEAAIAAKRQAPSMDISETYVNLGRVNMAVAGRRGPDAQGGCDPVLSDTTSIRQALDLFKAAPLSPNALQWKGCAEMALGDLNAAVASFRQAAATNSSTAATQLSLARGLYRSATLDGAVNPAQSWLESRAAFRAALAIMASPDPARHADTETRAKAHVELANVDLDYVQHTSYATPPKSSVIDEAVANLQSAIQLAPTQPEAFLRLGMIQIGEGPFASKMDIEGARGARANIATALRLAGGQAQRPLRAEANYLRSRLEVQKRRVGGGADAKAAISSADQAAELGDEIRGPMYFAQACEVRLLFGVTSGDGTRFCRADEGRDHDNYPEALLREGMYFLSKGSSARNRGDQSTAWDAAYAAFDRGVNRLPDFGRDDDSSDLRAKLLAGKGLALICSGLRKVGEDTIAGIPADLRRSAKSHFDAYGLPKCP